MITVWVLGVLTAAGFDQNTQFKNRVILLFCTDGHFLRKPLLAIDLAASLLGDGHT